ncbi:MAG: rhodanese-like domain-containing protein [Cellulosilyticaceae bacterium]
MNYEEINLLQAKELLNKQNARMVDVRSRMEYELRHIEGALHLPLEKISFEAEDQIEDKGQPIILYCRSGHRTKTARMILEDLGYESVYDLGSIDKWQ